MKVTIQDSRTSVTVEPRDFRVTVSGARGPQGAAGVGIAAGGAEGQILAKASATDYDTTWIDNFAPNVEVYVKNSSGSPMTKGQVVYISGADGTNPTISLAIATSEMGSSKTIGWLKQDLAQGDLGYVITEGLLEGINTNSAGAAGDPIWLSPTTAGGVVYGIANKPNAPNHLVFLGYVLRKNINNGKVYVKVQNGFELNELHDVYNGAKTTPVGNDALLLRDSADSDLWKRLTWTNALAGVKSHMDTFKSVANGYASLDGSGKVPASELPSYVDDVIEVANYAALPVTGETGKIYVTLDNNKCYRWTGSTYVEVSAGGASAWGAITGTLSNQTDLQTALDGKVDENAAITGATKTKITYDAKGLVTAGTDAAIADITGLQTALDGKQSTISLTTTGTSGAATLVGSTLNIPQYQGVLTNPVTGTGTAGQVAYFNGTSAVTGSNNLFWDAANGRLGVGTASPSEKLHIASGNATIGGNIYFGNGSHYLATDNSTYAMLSSNRNLQLARSGVPALTVDSSLNVVIGTTAASARLHVRGSGTTSATTALLVQNSTPSELFKVLDNGAWNFNGDGIILGGIDVRKNTGTIAFFGLTDLSRRLEVLANGNVLLGLVGWIPTTDGGNTTTVGSGGCFIGYNATGDLSYSGVASVTLGRPLNRLLNATSGQQQMVDIVGNFSPTSGTATFYDLSVKPTINQTGGANGITRGLYVNPTLTAAADWRSVETSNNTGYAVYAAGTANSYFGGRVGINTISPAHQLDVSGNIRTNTYVLTPAIYSSGGLVFGVSGGTAAMSIRTATRNTQLYDSTEPSDAGQRLQVYGSTLLRGSGTTSATTALLVQNSTPTNLLTVRDDGRIQQIIPGTSGNTVFGTNAANSSSFTGGNNTLIGSSSGENLTVGTGNTFIGQNTGASITGGNSNTIIGRNSGVSFTSGNTNTMIGQGCMAVFTSGSNNIAIGNNAGRFLSDGTTGLLLSNNNIYIGCDTKSNINNQTNQIVIGHEAIGNGSNTATIGNTSITATYLRGNINYTDGGNFVFGTTTGTKIGTATSQKIALWNATPIVQPTTAIAEAAFVENSGGTAVNVDSTFAGYTIQQIAQALKDIGILA